MIYTSCYNKLKQIQADSNVHPVAISVGIPRWYRGQVEKRLAPTRAMLKMDRSMYVSYYRQVLNKLDPVEIAESIGPGAVMLCWEAPGVFCHRRAVAEWLESALGLIVAEYGFERHCVRPYLQMPDKADSMPLPRAGMPTQRPLF